MNENREIRNTACKVVSDEEKRTVEGYALLFDVRSDGLSFEEVIQRGALDGVLEKSNVFALMNHDPGRGILARYKNGEGSLRLEIDQKGLKYRFEAPRTALGMSYLRIFVGERLVNLLLPLPLRKTRGRKNQTGLGRGQLKNSGNFLTCLRSMMALIQKLRSI